MQIPEDLTLAEDPVSERKQLDTTTYYGKGVPVVKILTIGLLNLRRLFRDRSNIFFVIIVPFLMIFMMGCCSAAASSTG